MGGTEGPGEISAPAGTDPGSPRCSTLHLTEENRWKMIFTAAEGPVSQPSEHEDHRRRHRHRSAHHQQPEEG